MYQILFDFQQAVAAVFTNSGETSVIMKCNFILMISLIASSAVAQGDPFAGGFGDGYSGASLLNQELVLSIGSFADGYASGKIDNPDVLLSLGSTGDGYDMNDVMNTEFILSLGSLGDGYTSNNWSNSTFSLSKGSAGDGYDLAQISKIYWTGDVDVDWLNYNNWSSLTVPINSDDVIIPPGRPNYPLLGNDLLSIGNPLITTGFRCAGLWIQNGGEVMSKPGTTLSNQSTLLINGELTWKNQAANSFLNFATGEVEIRNGGILRTQFN